MFFNQKFIKMAKCGREECIFKSIKKMVQMMKEEIAKTQNIAYPEQIVVAEIYNLAANSLAKACRELFKVEFKDCEAENENAEITMDSFILLKTLEEEGLISKDYKEKLFEALLRIKPELREKVEGDKKSGIL